MKTIGKFEIQNKNTIFLEEALGISPTRKREIGKKILEKVNKLYEENSDKINFSQILPVIWNHTTLTFYEKIFATIAGAVACEHENINIQ